MRMRKYLHSLVDKSTPVMASTDLTFQTGVDASNITAGVIPFTATSFSISSKKELLIEIEIIGETVNPSENSDIYIELSTDGGTSWTAYKPFSPSSHETEKALFNGDNRSHHLYVKGTFASATYDVRLQTTKSISMSTATSAHTIVVYEQVKGVGGGSGASAFVDLSDTPSSFTGSAGYVAKVNSTEDGVIFEADASGDATSIQGNPVGSPTSTEDGKVLAYDHTNGKFIYVADSGSSNIELPHFRSPPHEVTDNTNWTTGLTWDISTILTNAGVPSTAKKILLGFFPTELSDVSTFDFKDSGGVVLHTIAFGGDLPDWSYTNSGIPYGSMVAVDSNVTQIEYISRGGHYHTGANSQKRHITIYGWVEDKDIIANSTDATQIHSKGIDIPSSSQDGMALVYDYKNDKYVWSAVAGTVSGGTSKAWDTVAIQELGNGTSQSFTAGTYGLKETSFTIDYDGQEAMIEMSFYQYDANNDIYIGISADNGATWDYFNGGSPNKSYTTDAIARKTRTNGSGWGFSNEAFVYAKFNKGTYIVKAYFEEANTVAGSDNTCIIWKKMDVTANSLVKEVELTADATSITLDGLDLANSDYEIVCEFVNSDTTNALNVVGFFNSDTAKTGYHLQTHSFTGTSGSYSSTIDANNFGYAVAGETSSTTGYLQFANSYPFFESKNICKNGSSLDIYEYNCFKNATFTTITQLVLMPEGATYIGAGSKVRVYRR